ncbi:MAG: TonB-dependent receptor plug domain-containing protein [Candidatus Zophobacter franzmannii]|nr:TonB-dependent receptor plug domain-containing protein [Candidatus Zophobacter franzmannii]
MKRAILTLSLFSVILLIQAITYKVTDKKMKPLKGTIILCQNQAYYTDREGKADFSPTSDSLTVIHPGYLTAKVPTNTATIVLKKASYSLPGIKVTTQLESPSFKFGDSERIVIDRTAKIYDNSVDIFSNRTDIKISNSDLKGEAQTVSLLGHSSRHTAIIVDGVTMNPAGGSFDISSIPVEMIDSIEIVKNNASVSVGSGALAGAIIITTKQKDMLKNLSVWSKLDFGSFGFNRETMGIESKYKRLKSQLVISRLQSDNDYKYKTRSYTNQPSETAYRKNNSKEIYDINLKLELPLKIVQTVYSFMYQSFEKQLPGGYNFEIHYDKALQTGYLNRHNLKFDIEGGFSFTNYWHKSYSDYDNTNSSTLSSLLKTHNRNEITKYGSNLLWNRKNDFSELVLKAEYGNEQYSSDDLEIESNSISPKESSYTAGSIAGGLKPKLGNLVFELNASGRYDDYKLFDEFLSYRFYSGVVYESLINLKLGASYGTGFTVPSLESMYWKGLPSAIGNENLQAEESQGWQLLTELDYNEQVILKYSYNRNKIEDMIFWLRSSLAGGVWKPENLGKSQLTNHELGLELLPIEKLKIKTNCTFTDAIDKSNGALDAFYNKHIIYIPEYQVMSSIEYDFMSYIFSVNYSLTGRQWTTRDNLIDPLEPYGLLDAGVNRIFAHNRYEHRVSAKVNNILNEQYEIIKYIPQPGINWSISYQIKVNI